MHERLEGTLRHTTRAVRPWFSIVHPEWRDGYASVVRNIRHICRMDTIEDEICTLRALLDGGYDRMLSGYFGLKE